MPLPQALVDGNHVDWAEFAVGTLPGVAINGVAGLAEQVGLNRTVGAITGGAAAAGVASVVQAGLNEAGSIAELDSAAAGVEAVIGKSPNQFVTMLMRGPTYKHHQFTWELSPTNFAEANNLNQIITAFKNAMAPNFMSIGQGGGPVLWQFPNIFWIRLYPNSKFLYKFKPCVCDYFTVTYMPAGRGAFYVNGTANDGDNPPEGVQVQARFIELEFWVEGNYSLQGSVSEPSNDPSDVNNNNPAGTFSNVLGTLGNSASNLTSEITTQLQKALCGQ
jgi:hypothetical protein